MFSLRSRKERLKAERDALKGREECYSKALVERVGISMKKKIKKCYDETIGEVGKEIVNLGKALADIEREMDGLKFSQGYFPRIIASFFPDKLVQ